MRKLVLLGLLLALAVPVMAGPTVTLTDGPGSTGGGEFIATPTSFGFTPLTHDKVSPKFETFCVELDENVAFGFDYKVTFDMTAYAGGVNTNNGDPLDEKTAWLYRSFLNGSLTGYDYGAGRIASADSLQKAIWFIEEEITLAELQADAQADAWVTSASNKAVKGNFYGVQVMNLYYNDADPDNLADKYYRQSCLVAVPTPGALILGSLGMGVVGYLRRRRSL